MIQLELDVFFEINIYIYITYDHHWAAPPSGGVLCYFKEHVNKLHVANTQISTQHIEQKTYTQISNGCFWLGSFETENRSYGASNGVDSWRKWKLLSDSSPIIPIN